MRFFFLRNKNPLSMDDNDRKSSSGSELVNLLELLIYSLWPNRSSVLRYKRHRSKSHYDKNGPAIVCA